MSNVKCPQYDSYQVYQELGEIDLEDLDQKISLFDLIYSDDNVVDEYREQQTGFDDDITHETGYYLGILAQLIAYCISEGYFNIDEIVDAVHRRLYKR